MAARDVYRGLSKRMEKNKEREELQTLGASVVANLFKEQNKEMKRANENFARGNENVMQQIINYSDAEEDGEWFETQRATARTSNQSMGDYLVNEAANVKEAELTTQLGSRASHYNLKLMARELAEKQREELERIFDAGYNKAVSTDWDQAGFDDFRILNDGRSDNIGSAMWNVMKSPFVDEDPKITGDMLAEHLEQSVYGRDSSAMIGFRTALREGYELDQALNIADAFQDKESLLNSYKIPDKVKSYTQFNDTQGIEGNAFTVEVVKADGTLTKQVWFGELQRDEDGTETFTPNLQAQAEWDSGTIAAIERQTATLNGQDINVDRVVLKDRNGTITPTNDRGTITHLEETTPTMLARTATPEQRTAANSALNERLRYTLNKGYYSDMSPDELGVFMEDALGITSQAGEQQLPSNILTSIYNNRDNSTVAIANALEIRNNFTDTESLEIAAAIKSEELLSGATSFKPTTLGKTPFIGFIGNEGGYRKGDYDILNRVMSAEGGVTPLHLLNAYASAESSGTSFNIRKNTLLNAVINGSMPEFTQANAEEFDELRQEQINRGTYMPPLVEAVANNREMKNFIIERISSDPDYQRAMEDLIDLESIMRN